VTLANPGEPTVSINMFSIGNCSRGAGRSEAEDDNLKEIGELADLKCALRVMREALSFIYPWNKSVAVLESYLISCNFCQQDLDGIEKPASILTQFVDFILRENSNRWRGREVFVTFGEMKSNWDAFFSSRPAAMKIKSKKLTVSSNSSSGGKSSQSINSSMFWDDMCVMFNLGRCSKPQGQCKTKKGRVLRHCCNFRPDSSRPHIYCGLNHPACMFH
jgi:hypothetical protein